MLNIYENLHNELKTQLEKVRIEQTEPLDRFRESITVINKYLALLKSQVLELGFTNAENESIFFKHIKPNFYAYKILECERFRLVINIPSGSIAVLTSYYESELEFIDRFFRMNSFFYQYYKHRMTELDHHYFQRASTPPLISTTEVPELDPEFSSPLDYLFSKFIAYEWLREDIGQRLKNLSQPSFASEEDNSKNILKLRWTGDSINLVEVAYGIWLTGQINDGNASISEIIRWMEEHFQLKIGRAHRRWTEISGRKRNSYTKFLERMQESVNSRIDDELSVKEKR